MKIGTNEVVQVFRRNTEMGMIFQGDDLIYLAPSLAETTDYISNRNADKTIAYMVGNIPSTQCYPAYMCQTEIKVKCRFKKLPQYEVFNNTYYLHTHWTSGSVDYYNIANGTSLYDNRYRPGFIPIIGAHNRLTDYTATTQCDFQVYALSLDSSTKLRNTTNYKYSYDPGTGNWVTNTANSERYTDCSTGFVKFFAGVINGTEICVKTNFCPSENDYHTYKAYIETTEDSSNNIIIPHLIIDGVGYSSTYTFDKSINIDNYIFGTHSNYCLGRCCSVPEVHALYDANNISLSISDERRWSGGTNSNVLYPFDCRIDYNYVDIRADYTLSPSYTPDTDMPAELGYIFAHCIPVRTPYYMLPSISQIPAGLYCAQKRCNYSYDTSSSVRPIPVKHGSVASEPITFGAGQQQLCLIHDTSNTDYKNWISSYIPRATSTTDSSIAYSFYQLWDNVYRPTQIEEKGQFGNNFGREEILSISNAYEVKYKYTPLEQKDWTNELTPFTHNAVVFGTTTIMSYSDDETCFTLTLSTKYDASTNSGYVRLDAGVVEGEVLYVQTDFCPSLAEPHICRCWVEKVAYNVYTTPSIYDIIVHLTVDGVDYTSSYRYNEDELDGYSNYQDYGTTGAGWIHMFEGEIYDENYKYYIIRNVHDRIDLYYFKVYDENMRQLGANQVTSFYIPDLISYTDTSTNETFSFPSFYESVSGKHVYLEDRPLYEPSHDIPYYYIT